MICLFSFLHPGHLRVSGVVWAMRHHELFSELLWNVLPVPLALECLSAGRRAWDVSSMGCRTAWKGNWTTLWRGWDRIGVTLFVQKCMRRSFFFGCSMEMFTVHAGDVEVSDGDILYFLYRWETSSSLMFSG